MMAPNNYVKTRGNGFQPKGNHTCIKIKTFDIKIIWKDATSSFYKLLHFDEFS